MRIAKLSIEEGLFSSIGSSIDMDILVEGPNSPRKVAMRQYTDSIEVFSSNEHLLFSLNIAITVEDSEIGKFYGSEKRAIAIIPSRVLFITML